MRCDCKVFCHLALLMHEHRSLTDPALHDYQGKALMRRRLAQHGCCCISVEFVLNIHKAQIDHIFFDILRDFHLAAADQYQLHVILVSVLIFAEIIDQGIDIFPDVFSSRI